MSAHKHRLDTYIFSWINKSYWEGGCKVNKEKKCKGTGKAKTYGCGNVLMIHDGRYGLCDKCFITFLKESPYADEIIKNISKKVHNKALREEREERQKQKEEIKTLAELKKELQTLVNFIVRHIDYDHGCISCNHGWEDKWTRQRQAGHFFDKKHNDNLRFHMYNIFCQCTICNDRLSANLDNYRKGIINHFSSDTMSYIDSLPLKYKNHTFTIPMIRNAIDTAKTIKKDIISGKDYSRLEVNARLKLY